MHLEYAICIPSVKNAATSFLCLPYYHRFVKKIFDHLEVEV